MICDGQFCFTQCGIGQALSILRLFHPLLRCLPRIVRLSSIARACCCICLFLEFIMLLLCLFTQVVCTLHCLLSIRQVSACLRQIRTCKLKHIDLGLFVGLV